MSFRIVFDYRFDTSGFFTDPARRAALEAAGAAWESVIGDEFDDVPAGVEFTVLNPTTRSGYETVTLAQPIDDIVIFVGAKSLPGSTLGIAGPAGYSADGDVFSSRISSNFRGQGPVTDFEPWAGSMTFDSGANWNFDLGGPAAGKNDFMSVAVHEIGHVLGIGTSGAFDALVSANAFTGINATALNGGTPVPLHSDDSHVEDGFDGDSVALDPSLTVGTRKLVSEFDKAILADIGYQVTGYTAQGSQPAIATNGGETIYGTVIDDVIDGLGGADQIQGDDGDDTLFGGGGSDTLFGQAGADTLDGGAGNDQIQGGSGNDVLRGGSGDDDIWGQGGTDTFVLGPGDQQNTVSDFNLATEVIRLIDSGFASVAAALAAITKPYSNVSRLTISDGSYLDVFHASQSGSPLTASNIELVGSGGNSAPGGSIGIDGSAVEDATLAANTTGLSDADGLGPFSYSWFRDGVAISGADLDQYVLTQADVGAAITLRVGYTDGGGTAESVTSAATSAVLNVNDAPTGAVTVSGTAQQGATLSANAAGVADEDGLGGFSYTWLRDGVSVSGASGAAYVLAQDDVGARISVRVSYTDGQGTPESVTTGQTATVGNVNDAPLGGITISGTARQGVTLHADTTALTDADGLGPLGYAWLRDGVAISGALADQYQLTQADVAARITLRVSYTDGQGTVESVESAATPAVQNINDAPTGSVALSGTARQGETLSANAAGIGDADGLGVLSFAWLRDGVAIAGATGDEYLLTQADVGKQIAARVQYTDGQGTPESLTSTATAAVQNVNDAPTGSLLISGTAEEGEFLTADPSAIGDADGLGPLSFTWLRDGGPIAGANLATYRLVQDDVGARISARVGYTDGEGTAETVTSGQTAAIGNVNEAPTGSVLVSGTARQGETLTADASDLGDPDGLGSFSHAWLRDGVAIPGADQPTYLLGQVDVGAEITARISYTDGGGTVETVASAPTAPVGNVNDPPTGAVTLTGTPSQNATLVAITTGLDDADGLGAPGYTWLRDGAAIPGADADRYQAGQDDVGARISVRVSYTDGQGTPEAVTSAASGIIQNVNDAPSGGVAITGTAVEGATLGTDTASLGDLDGLGAFSFTWLRDGGTIGATGPSYELQQADVGARISVRVSFTDGHGFAEAVTGGPTAPVQNVNDAPTGSAGISGTAIQGGELSALTGGIADADGLGAFGYTWLRDGAPIPGADTDRFSLSQADVGREISVRVGYTDGQGTVESLTSPATAPVQNVNDAPEGGVTVTGTALEGETLSADTTGLADPDGLGALVFTWLRDGGDTGAGGPTYLLEQADVGARISVRVGYTDGQGTPESVASSETLPVLNLNAPPAGSVVITGTPVEDGALSADAGSITDADGLGPVSLAWFRDGAPTGVTGTGYTLGDADVGARMTAVASYTDAEGTAETVASAATLPVQNLNDPLTGSVTIAGAAIQGVRLTAQTGALSDDDGLGSFTFTWLRDGLAIPGASAGKYRLTQDDVGSGIAVRVSMTDHHGTSESATSSATAPVQNVNDAPTGTVSVNGSPVEGGTLTASASLSDPDGMGPLVFTWLRNGSDTGITGGAFALQHSDIGDRFSVRASYTDGYGRAESVESGQTGAVQNINVAPTGAVLVLGDTIEGGTLNADISALADADGMGPVTLTWLRDGVAFGAAGPSHVLGDADVGARLSVVASYRDGFGTDESVLSAATGPVLNVNDPPTGTVSITGLMRQGALLEAQTPGLSDADGLGPLAYQWLRDGTPIAGAGDLSYWLTQADVGSDISVAVSYTDGGGMAETVVSAERGAVQNVNDDPTGTVGISGSVEEGATLTATTQTLADADGLGTFTYTWLRDGTPINGATAATFIPGQSEVGARLSVQVGFRDGGGTDEVLTSPQTGPVMNINDPATGAVTISGSPVQGATLAADASAIGDADGIGPFTFTWYRDGVPVPGSADTHVLTQTDVGARLSVGVGFTDLHGTGETVVSAPTAAIENFNDAPTGVVRITGPTAEGELLTADPSEVRDADGLGPFTLGWLRDGVATGMTGPTYALTGDDIGARISVRLGFTDGGGTFEEIESAATSPVTNTNDPPVGGVLITGTASQGRELFADTASLSDGDGLGDLTFTWFRNGTKITGAGSDSYQLEQVDVGARIRVKVEYLDGQGTRETLTSPETGAVTDANDPVTGSVLILGTLREGRTIQANTGGLSDPEGLGEFSFTWLRDGAPIAGAASRSYKLVQGDVGKAISVQVRFIDGLGTEEFVASQARGPVSNLNDAPTGQVVIEGAAREKEMLSADISAIGDEDGLGEFSYTWLRYGTAFGAAGPTYLLGADDIGAKLSVRASFTDGQGTLETLTSATTGTVQNVNDAPTGALGIEGTEKEGETLVADASGIGDYDGLGAFSYQWLRDGTPIDGAEASGYRLQLADVGTAISVELRYTDQRGTFERIASAETLAIASVDDVMLGDDGDNVLFGGAGNDILSGGPGDDLLEGGEGADTFDINPGDETITIADFELGNDTIDLSDFERADAVAAFNGARPGSAILEFADGTLLTVEGDGVSPDTLTRENLVFASGNIAPAGLPVIGGSVQEGAGLSVDTSGIGDLEGIVPGSQRLQWLRDGQPIPGATGATLDLGLADVGAAISVLFSYLDFFGSAESVESARTAPISHAPMAVQGGNSPESLEGGMGDDVIEGMGGDDRLAGMAGDDLVDGGEGLDTAVFSGGQASYTLALSPTSARVTDRREGGNGADELVDVELLEFDGGMLDLAKFGGLAGLDPANLESFIELYIAYFNRAPDALGLNFWGTAFAAGVTLEEMAGLFSQGAEYRLTYPEGTTNLGFAETVYHNVLGRLPDLAGLTFWVGVLDSGYLERDAFILQVLRGAKVDPEPGQTEEFVAQQLADRDYLATKTDIGAYFAVHKGMSDVADAVAAMALYDGTQPGIAQAVNAIDMAFADALDAVNGEFLMPLIGVLDDPLGVV